MYKSFEEKVGGAYTSVKVSCVSVPESSDNYISMHSYVIRYKQSEH